MLFKTRKRLKRTILLMGIGLALLVIGYFLPLRDWIESLNEWTSSRGLFGALIFSLTYIVAVVIFLPSSVFTMMAGVAYGLIWGTLLSAVSATLGAIVSFLISRFLGQKQMQRWLGRREKLFALNEVVTEHQWKIIFLLRVTPIIPFGPINYSLGLSKVRFGTYIGATSLGILPGTFLYTYAGYAGNMFFLDRESRSTLEYILVGGGLLLVVALVVYISRLAKKALDEIRHRRA